MAIRKIWDGVRNCTDANRTVREIIAHQKMQHENIISLKNVVQKNLNAYLVYEYMGKTGNIGEWIWVLFIYVM